MIWDLDKIKELNNKAVADAKISYAKPLDLHVEGDYDQLAESYSAVVGAYDTLIELCWDLYDSINVGEASTENLDALMNYMKSLDTEAE